MEIKETVSQALTDSIKECFMGVLSLTLEEFDKADLNNEDHQVVASIGFAGQLEGNLSIIFSDQSACHVVGKMLYSEFSEVSPDVLDGVGEVVNMTIGGVKTRLISQFPIEISIPTTIKGKQIDVFSKKGLTRVYKCYRCAEFELDVVLYFKLQSEIPEVHAAKTGLSAAEKLAAFVDKNK